MEITLKSKFMSEEILEKRKYMIEKEKLHIQEELSKDDVKNLYNKYGKGFDEKDFAWAFLDIDELRYSNIEKGKTVKTPVLSYEYVSNDEFENIRNQVIKNYDIKHGEKRTCEEILEMYDKFGGRLSISLFLEDVLGIRGTLIKDFKKANVKNGKFNFDIKPGEYNNFNKKKPKIPMNVLNPDYIFKLRNKLFSEEDLHVGDHVSYKMIQELNKKYCPEMPEVIFAQKVIGIRINSYYHFKRTKIENTTNEIMFQDVDIPAEYIKELTNKIAILNKLEAGQLLGKEEFEEIYSKYGGILSKKNFAVLVLDMESRSYVRTIERDLFKNTTILSNRKKTDFSTLSEKIVKLEGFHHGDMIKYEQFKKIHNLYAPNVSEFVFAEKVLGITNASLQGMKYNGGRSRICLKLPSSKELKKLQKKIILENDMHINDKVDYKELERLYGIYGGILPIKMFAVEVLGIDKSTFSIMKNNKDRKGMILFDLVIPHSEIEKIKQRMMKDTNLQNNSKLTLEQIRELYNNYSGMMPMIMFAEEILGISVSTLNGLKNKRTNATTICLRPDFNEKEINILKEYLAQGLSDEKIATKMGVTVTFLKRNINNITEYKELKENNPLYEKVKLMNNRGKAPEEIVEELKISEEDVKEMLYICKKEQKEEEKKAETDRQQAKAEDRKQRKKAEIERRARKAIDDYEYKEKSIKNVRAYIGECRKSFEKGIFLRQDLDFLMECMIFVQCNCKEIELFSRMCILFNESKMARDFISENIDNEDIKPEEKVKLKEWRRNIDYAMKKEKALNLLRDGKKTPKEIFEATGVLEVDVIGLRKTLEKEKLSMIEGAGAPGEDERTNALI